jgi:hypothetical protein
MRAWPVAVLVPVLLPLDLPSRPAAAATPPAGEVVIESITTQGDGCDPASVVADISPDGQALTVVYSALTAEVTPAAPGTARRQCRLHLKLRVPKGWSYALENVDFGGYVFLEDGVRARHDTRFHIQGEAPERGAGVSWQDAHDEPYLLQGLGAGAPLEWSRCGKGKFVKITTDVEVSNVAQPDATGMVIVTSTDAQVYRLVWKKC